MNAVSRYGRLFLDVLYPRNCPVCRDVVTPKGESVCTGCREFLPYVTEPACMKCGKPINSEQEEYCEDCGKRKFSYERGYAVFTYDEVMQQAVADYKYNNKKEYAIFFAQELAEVYRSRLSGLGIEALVPVPIHRARRRYRGYNQTEVMCEELSRLIGIRVDTQLLVREKKTAPQKELSEAERLQNLESAIRWNPARQQNSVVPRTVLLVDDIYTTGSTAEVCARVLLRNGIQKVYLLCLCIGSARV